MSIANEISRIKTAKASLKNAINAKGGKLTDELLDKFADAVTALPSGSSVDLDGVTVTADQLREGVVAVDASGNKVTGTIPDSEVMTVESLSKIFISSGYLAESLEITDGSALEANLSAMTADSNAVLEFFTFVDAEGVLRNGSIRDWDSRTGNGIEVNGNTVTVLSGHRSKDTSVTVASTDTDLSFVTATASDILAGKVGIDTYGNPVNGTIPTVTASLTDNVVLIPAGYHDAAILTVPEAEAPTVSGNMVTVNKGYQDAEKIVTVGTAKGAETITPGTADRVINADTYLSGALTIKGDANFLEENIADGVSMWGKVGTHKGGGTSGMDFYKCAAVDSSANTWSGYKAVLAGGVYSFEENITTGLLYSAVTPVVGKVYTADALVQLSSLYFGEPVLISPGNLTSNVSNSEWEVIADSCFSAEYSGWKAFDGNPGGYLDGWLSAESSGNHWLGIRHTGSPVTVIAYGFYPAWSSTNNAPAEWELQGSNDGSDWVTIDVNSKIIDKESKENRFELSSPETFEYFRLYITRGQSTALYVAIGEFLLYGIG